MSDKTKEALEQAVRDHFTDTGDGAFLTDYILVMAGVDAKHAKRSGYVYESSESPVHSLYGLAIMASDFFGGDDIDDEDEDD